MNRLGDIIYGFAISISAFFGIKIIVWALRSILGIINPPDAIGLPLLLLTTISYPILFIVTFSIFGTKLGRKVGNNNQTMTNWGVVRNTAIFSFIIFGFLMYGGCYISELGNALGGVHDESALCKVTLWPILKSRN